MKDLIKTLAYTRERVSLLPVKQNLFGHELTSHTQGKSHCSKTTTKKSGDRFDFLVRLKLNCQNNHCWD